MFYSCRKGTTFSRILKQQSFDFLKQHWTTNEQHKQLCLVMILVGIFAKLFQDDTHGQLVDNRYNLLLGVLEELHDGAGVVVDGEGDDVAAVDGVEGGGEQVALLGGNAVFDAHVADLKTLGQQFHRDAHVVGVVHVAVVVDVGAHDLYGRQLGAVVLGQDDAAATVVHLLFVLEGERGDGVLRESCKFACGKIDKGAHAPRAVTGLALGVADEGVAEAIHRQHFIDGRGHRQVLLEVRHAHDLDLARRQQLRHVIVTEELTRRWLAVYPHLGAVLHHLQGRVEFQFSLAVAAAGSHFIIECVHSFFDDGYMVCKVSHIIGKGKVNPHY